jgi:hypothetical protein
VYAVCTIDKKIFLGFNFNCLIFYPVKDWAANVVCVTSTSTLTSAASTTASTTLATASTTIAPTITPTVATTTISLSLTSFCALSGLGFFPYGQDCHKVCIFIYKIA